MKKKTWARGRKKLEELQIDAHVRLPVSQYVALRQRGELSAQIRQALALFFEKREEEHAARFEKPLKKSGALFNKTITKSEG